MKIFCSSCKGSTNHKVLKEVTKTVDDEENSISFTDTWQIVECLGCENVSFRQESYNSDEYDWENQVPIIHEKVYPIRGKDILPIKPYYDAPPSVRNIYRETIDAYNNNMPVLCAGGLRSILESICNALGIIDGPVIENKKDGSTRTVRKKDLMAKINGLHEKGYITKQQNDFLHEHRYLGNDALHTTEIPSKNVLKIAIEVIEHTMDMLYELGEKAGQLTWQRLQKAKRAAAKSLEAKNNHRNNYKLISRF